MYLLIVSLIQLYTVAGKNGAAVSLDESRGDSIELSARGQPQNKWYARVPNAESQHIIGNEDDGE